MEYFKVEGGKSLSGEVKIHGAKNSILPLLAGAYLCKGQSVFTNCPELSDVRIAVDILRALGAKVTFENHTVTVDAQGAFGCEIPEEMMREMRSSIIFLSGIAAKTGKAVMSYPGGCEIGERPIDLHLKALRTLGAEIYENGSVLHCEAESGFTAADIFLSFPSVGATENIIIAAATAKGRTTVYNAAMEPEITDLARYLNKCGADISGYGTAVIVIEGKKELHGCEYSVMPDRIEASTLLAAACANKGDIRLLEIDKNTLLPVIEAVKEMGCEITEEKKAIRIIAPKRTNRVRLVETKPYPGFPTDAQAAVMAAACTAQGTSTFIENIFENRFKHSYELMKMGANIKVQGTTAIVEGVKALCPAELYATDLRAGAALLIAAMGAEGESRIYNTFHIDRGYEKIEEMFSSLGAKIQRVLKG